MIAVAHPLRSIELSRPDHRALVENGFHPFIRFEANRRIQVYVKLDQNTAWVVSLERGRLGVTVLEGHDQRKPSFRLDRTHAGEALDALFGRVRAQLWRGQGEGRR